MFSLSSVSFTQCCLEDSSFNFTAFLPFKCVFTGLGERCLLISGETRLEFGSSDTAWTSGGVFGASAMLISFSEEKERRLFIPRSLLLSVDTFSVSSEFDISFNMLESSAIVLNIRAGLRLFFPGASWEMLVKGKKKATFTSHIKKNRKTNVDFKLPTAFLLVPQTKHP